MTDHHDELASAYLDGQVSPEEAARVEGDPRLMAEVDALAAVVERLQTEEAPTDPTVRQRHLSAALAAFDQASPTNVIPLGSRADRAAGDRAGGDEAAPTHRQPGEMAQRAARVASARASDRRGDGPRSHTRQRQGLPAWLSAAAVLLVIGGGIGWFASRQGQSDETAAVSVASDDGAEGASSDAALSQATEAGGGPLSTVVDENAAKASVENAAGAGGAAEAQPVVPAPGATSGDFATTATTAAAASTTTSRPVTSAAPVSTAVPPGGLSFDATPTGAEVEARVTSTGVRLQPAGESACGGAVTAPAGTVLTGYVPLTVGGAAGEGLFYRAGSGSGATTVLVVRTSSCQAFS